MTEPHSKLVEAVAQLDKGQRIKKAERSEPTIEVSEYHLVKSGISNDNVVRPEDLAKSLGQKGHQHEITKKLRYVRQKCKVLPKPLEKPAAERIKRVVGFDETKKELSKWNATIARNRTVEHLSFPLNHAAKMKNSPTTEYLKRFRIKSDLMKRLEEVDPSVQFPAMEQEKDDKDENVYQDIKTQMIDKRKEAARLRALQSYKEAKARRQRKIKSKKFHRIQRKEKVKQQLKDFEKLQKVDPQEALTKLDQLDRSRAEERMSLRHKNTGKWAKNKQIRAKYDNDTRQVLAEQLAIGRELTQKIRMADSDEENEEDQVPFVISKENKDNSSQGVKTKSEINEFIQSYRTYWDKKNQEEKEKKVSKTASESNSDKNCSLSKNKSEKQNSDEASKSKEANTTNKEANITNKEISTVNKKANTANKEANTRKKEINTANKEANIANTKANRTSKEAKDKKRKNFCNDACMSVWDVEEVQSNEETKDKRCNKKSKISKLQSIDEMFDLLEENIQRKADLKLQKAKKKREINSKKKIKKQEEKKKKEEESEDNEDIPDLEFTNFNPKPILDQSLDETIAAESLQEDNRINLMKIANTEQEPLDKSNDQKTVDLDKYDNIKPKDLETQLPDLSDDEGTVDNTAPEDGIDEYQSNRIQLTEMVYDTFAEDGQEDFTKEKEEESKNKQPENSDGTMPGWGSWSGPNITKNKRNRRKKQTILLNVPNEAPRKDENKGKLIIFEDTNKKLKEHLVSELPYPFTTVNDYEATLRAPVSRTFVPENAHRRLIQPAVETKIGQVIEPMDEDVLVKKQPMVKKPQKRGIDKKSNSKRSIVKNNKKRRVN
ncbi:U3 small nucleolar RNA-associated protein 14-like protein A [Ooceraea biroi]|uniref:U3 small nucleolar RNA-associated protein 14-like protein A n=1 Tax=Ooceraea biroi TaxID=2015173 RepID=A0A026WEU9_OOCBI|nr:U3 small nucleolar RNA-associated protein 14-like protein A [Ooceraea biroi]